MNKNIKLIFLLMFFSVFLIGITSASLFQSNKVFKHNQINLKQKHFLDKYGDRGIRKLRNYGTYEIHENRFLNLFRGDTVQTYTLLDSGNSVINAWAILEVKNYRNSKLLNGLSFKGGTPRDIQISYFVNESYFENKPIYKKVCGRNKVSLNGTINKNCNNVLVRTDKILKYKAYWKPYLNQLMPIGNYKIKINGKLPSVNKKVDWILNSGEQNQALDKWAWWNITWLYKKQINFTANVGQFSYLETIPYSANMNADFSDLRFVDTATETTELNYTIESYTTSTSAIIRIFSQGASNVMMYYGNSLATTTSSASNTYFNPVSYYYLDGNVNDALGVNNGTNNGATSTTGKIGTAYSFDGATNYISLGFENTAQSFTLGAWIYINAYGLVGAQYIGGIFGTGATQSGYLSLRVGDGTSGNNNKIFSTFGNSLGGYNDQIGATVLSLNTWYYVTTTYDGTTLRVYVNGVDDGNSAPASTRTTGTNFNIGVENGISRYFNGKIDEAIIYNRALTATQVSNLYQATVPTFTVGSEQAQTGVSTTLNSPINVYNSSSQNILFNWTSTPTNVNLTNTTLYLWDNTGSLLNSTFYSLNGSSSVTITQTNNFSDGNYIWNAETCVNNGNCAFASNRTFSVDTTYPNISIQYAPNGTFDYIIINKTMDLNFTTTDSNLNNCWYNYNNTNTSVSCVSAVQNNLQFTYQKDQNNLTIYSDDTYGNLASYQTNWSYNIFDFNNYTYNQNITESTQTLISGKFGLTIPISSSYLYYNNVNYSTSIDSLGNKEYVLSKTITSPVISSDTNVSWFFWVNGKNTTLFNQTILNINLDTCGSYTFKLINYTLVDEETQLLINNVNSTIESSVFLKTGNGDVINSLYSNFKGNNSPQICSQINVSNIGLRLWEQTRYGSDNYVFKIHNIQNGSINGLINIPLYNLPSIDATTFRIIYKSIQFLPIPNAIINIQRKYLGEGVYKSVESPMTDANGEVSGSFNLNSVLYKITVSQNGKTLDTFNNPAVACDNLLTGDCKISLSQRQNVNTIPDIDTFNDFTYSLVQDNRTITLDFNVPSGISKIITLFVNQSSILGNKTSCNQTVLSSSGSINCVIADSFGDTFTNIKIYVNNKLITTGSTQILDDRSQYFGTNNVVLTFFFVLSLVLLMLSNPISVIFGLILGVLTSGLMMITNSGSLFGVGSVLLYLVIIAVLLIYKIAGRR